MFNPKLFKYFVKSPGFNPNPLKTPSIMGFKGTEVKESVAISVVAPPTIISCCLIGISVNEGISVISILDILEISLTLISLAKFHR